MAHTSNEPLNAASPVRNRDRQDDSLDYPDADPWSSPALHRGHNHADQDDRARNPNGTSTSKATDADRGMSPRNGASATGELSAARAQSPYDAPTRTTLERRDSGGWASFGGSTINAFPSQPDAGLGPESSARAGGDPRGNRHPNPLARSLGAGRVPGGDTDELVTVALLPDKEGIFLFQHRNYQVSSRRRGAKVIRRYSDFVWLLNCLIKRYPFRQLPLLPPKRVAGKDATFLSRRRRRRRLSADAV